MRLLRLAVLGSFLLILAVASGACAHETVLIKDNQLFIDGEAQPQLFGAEVQYFRMRGGYGPNMPREKVIALWNKALDRVVEAKMNAISFYIPWDFHEYAEGKFDFTGTADEDGDGRPDYPSRDLVTFLKLVKDHGIKRVMVRPGPYINAEWGFLGFGAVPSWFHDKFPNSHMTSPGGLKTKPVDYFNPDFLEYTRRWFSAVYPILQPYMGKDGPIAFLQLDNETNYQWSSIYNHDYGPRAIARYQDFLSKSYGDLTQFNQTHQRHWKTWAEIQPPTEFGKNTSEDQDWYRFADQSMYEYLQKIRGMWEAMGAHEPQILFTSAESYNATDNGVLPNYVLRNSPGRTGLMTVNLYPKTFESENHGLLNQPFKADLDVKSEGAATTSYLGQHQQWVMGPEIQGGWWRGINVTEKARQQTYLTVLGHGLKALFVYYFNEGQNWQVEWGADHIRPFYEQLRKEWNLTSVPVNQLSDKFWGELQTRVDHQLLLGFDVRHLMQADLRGDQTLFFDAPLDADVNPRGHFDQLKKIGENIIAPYGKFLGGAVEVVDDVALVKDSTQHVPTAVEGLNAAKISSDWSGALLGHLLHGGVNPQILHGDISSAEEFISPKLLIHLDTGVSAPRTQKLLAQAFDRGQGVVNWLASDTARRLNFNFPEKNLDVTGQPQDLIFYLSPGGRFQKNRGGKGTREVRLPVSDSHLFVYDLIGGDKKNCEGILFYQGQTVGYLCKSGEKTFIQMGAMVSAEYNSSEYAQLSAVKEHQVFMRALLTEFSIQPRLQFSEGGDQVVAFARVDPKQRGFVWITVKSGAPKQVSQALRLQCDFAKNWLSAAGQSSDGSLRITELISNRVQTSTPQEICHSGFKVDLAPEDSAVFAIQAISETSR